MQAAIGLLEGQSSQRGLDLHKNEKIISINVKDICDSEIKQVVFR